jgi:hypothetical protein
MGQRIGTIKSNDVQVVVWKNGDYFSFQIQKVYFNSRENEWKKAESVFATELDDVIKACNSAKEWLIKKGIAVKSLPKETALAGDTVKKVLNKLGIERGTHAIRTTERK